MAVYRILSLDGGGIRGAATAQFLVRLEEGLGRPLHEVFDYFAGTSTGALIAMNLALNKASARDSAALYSPEIAAQIMDKSVWDRLVPMELLTEPKYDGKGKTRVLKRVFRTRRFRNAGKPVLVTAYDINRREIVVFKSDGGSESAYDPPAWEVADATSAAPTYFPTVRTSATPAKWLVDGGVAANCPAMCALAEALKKQIPAADIRLLSIGTGLPNRGSGQPDETGEASRGWGGLEWLRHGLVDHLFSGNMGAASYMCQQILGAGYLRVNGPLVSARDDMDDISTGNINNLRLLGDLWFRTFGADALRLLK